MSSNSANIAAVAQAMKEAAEARLSPGTVPVPAPTAVVVPPPGISGLGKLQAGTGDGVGPGGYPSPPSSLPNPGPLSNATIATHDHGIHQLVKAGGTTLLSGSAIAEGHAPEVNRGSRNRRASDGAGALGGVGKIGRMRSGSELKCEKCGKGYKHSSCLTKHLWEHTPEWSYTSKLLISKHQQVQLLEAASILVSMNPTPPDSSSGASNNEGNSDSSSSDETTPPPSGMSLSSPVPTPRGIRNGSGKPGKRYSSGSYSRSYNGSSGFLAGSAPSTGLSFPNHLPQRPLPRPRAGSSVSGVRGSVAPSPSLRPSMSEDDALAAAVELLSCSFNTPIMSPSMPVGSVPRGFGLGLSDIGSPPAGGRAYMGPLNDVVEMKKEEDEDEEDRDEEDEDEGRSEEEDDGVFGRMEE
ncbi:hypothetical protein BZA05DRAFT_27696 [Tricharina praecox]|uniref:uncharacterized protein n=1 Tax=Tricharina praecox TaxID=43433 RepID=UPI00222076DD|nr:uncharacterized protein BZA05DRAFT_27696 [Tricharina praecox]KAI5853394.1 hypothetical protein BZA05DRAFT_27696 [Tricharina praecox]